MTPVVVLDASAMLAFVLREPSAPLVDEVFDLFASGRLDIVEPSLWYYEVGNTLHQKRSLLPNEGAILYTFSLLKDVGFRTKEPDVKEIEQAFAILGKHRSLTFYDAIYHAMAIVHRGVYITADDRYTIQANHFGHIVRLKDLPPYLGRLRTAPR